MTSRLDLNLIQLLVSIVQAGTMSAAAQRLGVTRSQVSRGLKKLERDMGAQLLRRTTRQLELTQQGALVYEHGLRAMREVDTARYLVQRTADEPTGYIRVSVPIALGEQLLGKMLIDFARRYKGISLRVVFSNRINDLISSEIDVAVRVVDQPPNDYVARKVTDIQWYLCASAGYLAQTRKIRTPQQLGKLDILMPPSNKRSSTLVLEKADQQHTVRVSTKLESESFPYLAQAAEMGLGVVLLPAYYAINAIRENRLQRVLPDYQVLLNAQNHLYILTAPNLYPSSASRAVVEFLVKHLADELVSSTLQDS